MNKRFVNAARSRRRLRYLARCGIGRYAVAEITGLAHTTVRRIRNGKAKMVLDSTESAILLVTKDGYSASTLVDAAPTWLRINELLDEGFTKAALVRRLGYKQSRGHESLQLNPDRVTARNEARVRRLYDTIMR